MKKDHQWQELAARLRRRLDHRRHQAVVNLDWLLENLNPYFFLTMVEHPAALDALATGLDRLEINRHLLLADQQQLLIRAGRSEAGSIYHSLAELQEKPSYAEITHSYGPLPESKFLLEIQRYEFKTVKRDEIRTLAAAVRLPRGLYDRVAEAMRRLYPEFPLSRLRDFLRLLAANDLDYLRISPPERIARLLWLYFQGRIHDGLYFAVEEGVDACEHPEVRVMLSVGNPPGQGFLKQVFEVFHRLEGRVSRAYCLEIETGDTPHFLGTFYLARCSRHDEEFFRRLQVELFNSQILASNDSLYQRYVLGQLADGQQLSLIMAMVAFCHSNLAHNQPDVYDLGEVRRAFHGSPEIALALAAYFRARFRPGLENREDLAAETRERAEELLAAYNTGHRHFDQLRRRIFATAMLLIRFTLKTNFYVSEKHALAFRLDPAYLTELGAEFTADLPAGAAPFRLTFFYGRYGAGYHVGFSDIARGGWRTVSCTNRDDFFAAASSLLREVYVLAHTQHLKNKDIYEGGSKMVVVHDVSDLADEELRRQSLYKLQFGFINAFFDIFVTAEDGTALHPAVVDYYREDEPIELGPDENMHDAMIELIARQSQKRGYLLGRGVISSKKIGINHKEYGVTSLGVITFAEITMARVGIDMHRDEFRVKLTGGPNGDVAGNAIRLLLERCPRVKIVLLVAGSGVLFDPQGLDHQALSGLVLRKNIDDFSPNALNPGGFVLLRRQRRRDGLAVLYRKLDKNQDGVVENWVTADEFHREFDQAIFTVPAELFIPAGGRPETIDENNWSNFFLPDGSPSCRVIVEGANSFITPPARELLQERGIIIMRDAAANKCGVISSSYEIIANLLLSEREFVRNKAEYVADVLEILEKRAADEARLILDRQARTGQPWTAVAGALSEEINRNYQRLFEFFLASPEFLERPSITRVLQAHLPEFLRRPRYRARLRRQLPRKYRAAMAAVEISARMVYDGDWQPDFALELSSYIRRKF